MNAERDFALVGWLEEVMNTEAFKQCIGRRHLPARRWRSIKFLRFVRNLGVLQNVEFGARNFFKQFRFVEHIQ